jgi:hypothetical protein
LWQELVDRAQQIYDAGKQELSDDTQTIRQAFNNNVVTPIQQAFTPTPQPEQPAPSQGDYRRSEEQAYSPQVQTQSAPTYQNNFYTNADQPADTSAIEQQAKVKNDLVNTASNYIRGAKQGYQEQAKQEGNLRQIANVDEYGDASPKEGITQEQVDAQKALTSQAQTNFANETVLPTMAFIPGMNVPAIGAMMANQAINTYQNTEGTPLGKIGNAVRAITYGPAVDMYNDPNLSQEFNDRPVSTGANAILAGAQALLPLYVAKKGIGKILEKKPDLPQNIINDTTPTDQPIHQQLVDAVEQKINQDHTNIPTDVEKTPTDQIRKSNDVPQEVQVLPKPLHQDLIDTVERKMNPQTEGINPPDSSDVLKTAIGGNEEPITFKETIPDYGKIKPLNELAQRMLGTDYEEVLNNPDLLKKFDDTSQKWYDNFNLNNRFKDEYHVLREVVQRDGLRNYVEQNAINVRERQTGQDRQLSANTNTGRSTQISSVDGKSESQNSLNRSDNQGDSFYPKNNKLTLGFDPTGGKFDNMSMKDVADKMKNGFYSQDLKPLVEDAINTGKNLGEYLSPASVNEHTRASANAIRDYNSQRDTNYMQAEKGLKNAVEYFDKQTPEAQKQALMDYQEGNITDPVLKPIVDAMKSKTAETWQNLVDMGKDKDFEENFLPQQWESSPQNTSILKRWQNNPLNQPTGWLNKKVIPSYREGIAMGMTPADINPARAILNREAQTGKWMMGEHIKNELTNSGEMEFVKPGEAIPETEGNKWVAIKGENNPLGASAKGAYFARPEVATLINRFVGDGESSVAYKRYMQAANVMNQFQLLGGFHMGKTAWETTVSKLTLVPQLATDAISNMEKGDFKTAGKNIADAMVHTITAPAAPLQALLEGHKFINKLLDPKFNSDPLVQAYRAGGGKIGLQKELDTNYTASMRKAFSTGNYTGAVGRAPLAMAEKLAGVTTHWWVPKQKAGVFKSLMDYEMKRDPTLIDDRSRLRSVSAKIIDSIDNREGSINWDNLFLSPNFKKTLFATMRAPGFSGGTIRDIGGGITDLLTTKQRMSRGDKFMSQRMAYDIALPIASMTANYAMQWFQTGQQPDLKTEAGRLLYEHKNGQKDDWGNDKYSGVPSYTKDVMSWVKQPAFDTITNKAHPLISALSQIVRNRDYFNTKISNPDDDYGKQALDVGKFATGQMMPFGINNTIKAIGTQGKTPMETAQNTLNYAKNASGHNIVNAILPNIGMAPTPSSLTMTDAQKKASEIIQDKMPQGSKTQEQTDQSQLKSQLRKAVIGQTQLPEIVLQAVRDGQISKDDAKKIWTERNEQPLAREVKSSEVSIADTTKIWALATDVEKEQIRPEIIKKISNVMHNEKATPEQKKQALDFFHNHIKR